MTTEMRRITIFCKMPYLYRDKASYFPPKSQIISGSFSQKRHATQGKDLYALPPPCKMRCKKDAVRYIIVEPKTKWEMHDI